MSLKIWTFRRFAFESRCFFSGIDLFDEESESESLSGFMKGFFFDYYFEAGFSCFFDFPS